MDRLPAPIDCVMPLKVIVPFVSPGFGVNVNDKICFLFPVLSLPPHSP